MSKTRDKSRCSLCGAARIPLNRAKTEFGVCTFIECKNPAYDLDREKRERPALVGICNSIDLMHHSNPSVPHERSERCVNFREPAPGEPRTCEYCGGRVFIESTHGPGKCVPAQTEGGEKWLVLTPEECREEDRRIHATPGTMLRSKPLTDNDAQAIWNKLTNLGTNSVTSEPASPPAPAGGAREFPVALPTKDELHDLGLYINVHNGVTRWVNGRAEAAQAIHDARFKLWKSEREARERAEGALREMEQKYRNNLWLCHGHDSFLYGDDGEMQCNGPHLADFKRDPIEALEQHCHEAALAALKSSQEEGKL